MQEEVVFSMEGGIADNHEIPAYLGSKSIYGFSRSLLIVTNLIVEGRVRKKDYDYRLFSLNLKTPRPGSFELVFDIGYVAAAAAGAGVVGNAAYDLLKYCARTLTGQKIGICGLKCGLCSQLKCDFQTQCGLAARS